MLDVHRFVDGIQTPPQRIRQILPCVSNIAIQSGNGLELAESKATNNDSGSDPIEEACLALLRTSSITRSCCPNKEVHMPIRLASTAMMIYQLYITLHKTSVIVLLNSSLFGVSLFLRY